MSLVGLVCCVVVTVSIFANVDSGYWYKSTGIESAGALDIVKDGQLGSYLMLDGEC
jgi:hypothetical protein